MSNLFRGLTWAASGSFINATEFGRLWPHECNRIYRDRMITENQEAAMTELIRAVATKTLAVEGSKFPWKSADESQLIFTTFVAQQGGSTGVYQPIPDVNLKSVVLEGNLPSITRIIPSWTWFSLDRPWSKGDAESLVLLSSLAVTQCCWCRWQWQAVHGAARRIYFWMHVRQLWCRQSSRRKICAKP